MTLCDCGRVLRISYVYQLVIRRSQYEVVLPTITPPPPPPICFLYMMGRLCATSVSMRIYEMELHSPGIAVAVIPTSLAYSLACSTFLASLTCSTVQLPWSVQLSWPVKLP
jgi:hypothetical protein